jgi:hypothetical protein
MYHKPGFINRHTAPAILILIMLCFFAGYQVGKTVERQKYMSTVCLDGQVCY